MSQVHSLHYLAIDKITFLKVQYGVFTARAILSFQGAYNGLGPNTTSSALEEAKVRSYKSLKILDQWLGEQGREWLALNRPTIADLAVFVYVALSPMGDIDLKPYPEVLNWIERVKKLPNFIPIDGLEDPMYRRK